MFWLRHLARTSSGSAPDSRAVSAITRSQRSPAMSPGQSVLTRIRSGLEGDGGARVFFTGCPLWIYKKRTDPSSIASVAVSPFSAAFDVAYLGRKGKRDTQSVAHLKWRSSSLRRNCRLVRRSLRGTRDGQPVTNETVVRSARSSAPRARRAERSPVAEA